MFYAVPTVAWALQMMRPDVLVHTVVENAASMQQTHQTAILRAMGGLDPQLHLRAMNAGDWSAFPRNRYFFLTLEERNRVPTPQRRPPPWEEQWAPLPGTEAELGPMMRSRCADRTRASTVQYKPRALLYRRPRHEHDDQWAQMPIDHIILKILRRMPPHISDLYRRLIYARAISIELEREVEPALAWIDEHGREAGFRVPTAQERARATGRDAYLNALYPDDEVQLYNVVGNHFDQIGRAHV